MKTLLEIATDITTGDRRRDYGRPLVNHLRIAMNWTLFLQPLLDGKSITPDKVVWMMAGLKQAREINTTKFDNLLDNVGYSACLDDMYLQIIELGYAVDREEAMEYMQSLDMGEMFELLIVAERDDKRASMGKETPRNL